MVQLGRPGDAGTPGRVLYYRDYIKSNHWELRKQQYYQRHAKACRICGDTTGVELNHIRYGNYGRERDKDLVPLCRTHHQALHDTIGVRKDMHYQTEYFLADMIAAWDAEHEKPVQKASSKPAGSGNRLTIYMITDTLARPIWRVLAVVLFWRK